MDEDYSKKRNNLRPQLVKGETTKGGLLGDDWLRKKWPELLDAHFICKEPGEAVCLADVLTMLATGKVNITKTYRGNSQPANAGQDGRDLTELEKHLIVQWYDAKDKELQQSRGDPYVAQRNLSAQASASHENNKLI